MKEFINKIILTCVAIMIACTIVYGIVYAQQPGGNIILDACIPTPNRILVSYSIDNPCRISPSQRLNNQQQSNPCSNCMPADFGPGNACCETDRCDVYSQATEFSLSFMPDICLNQKSVSSFDTGNGAKASFDKFNLSSPHKTVPIYKLTESIIC